MANRNLPVTMILRNDTTNNWSTNNPVLSKGEAGYDNQLKLLKIGDGVNTWSNLEQINPTIFDGKESSYYLDYNNFTNKPIIRNAGYLNTNNTDTQTVNEKESLTDTIKLHKVSKTGNYNDLLNKPTIPTSLKNPNKLIIGTTEYDGSTAVTLLKVDASKKADEASKVTNKLSINNNGTITEYDGSSAKTVVLPVIPESLKNPNKLIIGRENIVNNKEYDGSTEITIDTIKNADIASKLQNQLKFNTTYYLDRTNRSTNLSSNYELKYELGFDGLLRKSQMDEITSSPYQSFVRHNLMRYFHNASLGKIKLILGGTESSVDTQLESVVNDSNIINGSVPNTYGVQVHKEFIFRFYTDVDCELEIYNWSFDKDHMTTNSKILKKVVFPNNINDLTLANTMVEFSIIDDCGLAVKFDVQ